MGKKQRETVLRITACYAAEVQSGQQPLLSHYLARYPRYASAIVDFVSYYHAIEVELPVETHQLLPFSPISRVALQRLPIDLFRLDEGSKQQITPLMIGDARPLSEIAIAVGLSEDVIMQLEQREVDPFTIPQELLCRLAVISRQSVPVLRAYFATFAGHEINQSGVFDDRSHQRKVAEDRTQYEMYEPRESFRSIVEKSTLLSDEQKSIWCAILTQEGL